MMMKGILTTLLLLLFLLPLSGQETQSNELPEGYGGVTLGMNLEELKAALTAHPYLLYRGDPDVSLLSRENETLIQCEGTSFMQQGSFQLYNGALYIITFMLNPDRIDYYSVFTTLKEKYGDPDSLSPTEAVWINDTVRVSLEKPLSIKYIDTEVFTNIIESSKRGESLNVKEREDFLEGF